MNNDGKKEIIYASDLRKDKTTIFIKNSNFDIIGQKEIDATINTTACFDIDNDGIDEIILGSNLGKLYIYKYSENDRQKFIQLTRNKFNSHSNKEIRSIKALKLKNYDRNLIIIGSIDGTFGIYYFNKNNELEQIYKEKLYFQIWSILPIYLNNLSKIILGGEGIIALYEFNSPLTGFSELSSIPIEDYETHEGNKEERIYDIAILKEYQAYPKFFRIICATRNGKPLIYDVGQNEIKAPIEFPPSIRDWEGSSSYSIILFDIDKDDENEIIIAGKTEYEKGCIEVYKFNDTEYWRIKENVEYEYEIYSIKPYLKENKILILVSMLHYPLITLESEESKRLEKIIKSLGEEIVKKPGQYVFFTGAGFSLPIFKLADQIKKDIMKDSEITEEDLMEYLKQIESEIKNKKQFKNFFNNKDIIERLPLEFLLFYIKRCRGDVAMKEIISKYFKKEIDFIPSGIKILGEIIRKNYINTVFTSNYDLLLETELKDRNEINKIIRDEDYKSTKICGNKAIIKLHGCVTDINSIAAAIDEVDSLAKNTRKVIDFIFNGHIIIFVGYSCRDLDIFPILKKIVKENNTICYFVDPAFPNKNVDELLKLSGGDIYTRYFSFTSNDFFEILRESIEIKKEVI